MIFKILEFYFNQASTQFYVTIRLNILPFVLENILTEQINAKPANAKVDLSFWHPSFMKSHLQIVKLCDDLLGATFKSDTGLVSLDESDEDVGVSLRIVMGFMSFINRFT